MTKRKNIKSRNKKKSQNYNNQNKISDLNNKVSDTNNQNKISDHIKSYHIPIYDEYNLETCLYNNKNYIKEKIIKLSNKYQGIKFCITVNIISYFSFIVFKLSSRKICATTYTLMMFDSFELASNQILDYYKKVTDDYYSYYHIQSLKQKIYELNELE